MMGEPVDYDAFVRMIKAFEKKYSRKMTWNELVAYIAAARKIQMQRARVYARDLCYLHKVFLNNNREIEVV